MKIVLSDKELISVIHSALCNGLDYISGYQMSVQMTKDTYQEAKASIKEEERSEFNQYFKGTICIEEVLVKHLSNGNTLNFWDGTTEEVVGFDLAKAKENLQNEDVTEHVLSMLNETDDAITADCILQSAIFGDIIYG